MKINKTLIFIVVFLFLIGGLTFWYLQMQQTSYNENLAQIENVKNHVDELIDSSFESGDMKDSTENPVEIIVENYDFHEFDSVFEGVKDYSVSQLKDIYSQLIKKGDVVGGLDILESIYQKTKNSKFAELIVNKSLEIYDFDRAHKYVIKIQENDPTLKNFDVKTFFYVLFNHSSIDTDFIEKTKQLLEYYLANEQISTDDYNFYYSLLAISRNNMDGFKDYFYQLPTEGEYQDFVSAINNDFSMFQKYHDVSSYYLDSLLALTLFKHGFFEISEKLAKGVLKINENYVLANQILAYNNFVINNVDESIKYFNKLININYENANQYNFYIGITYYWDERYEDSIIYLSQVKDSIYAQDILRYLILAYEKIKDYRKIPKLYSALLETDNLNEYDYYNFFDMFFYKPWSDGAEFSLLEANSKLALRYLLSCYNSLEGADSYICNYGKGGYYFASGNDKKAIQYLLYLSNYFQRTYIFQAIGEYYAKINDFDKAKKYYIKAIIYSNDIEQKDNLKNTLYKVLFK